MEVFFLVFGCVPKATVLHQLGLVGLIKHFLARSEVSLKLKDEVLHSLILEMVLHHKIDHEP